MSGRCSLVTYPFLRGDLAWLRKELHELLGWLSGEWHFATMSHGVSLFCTSHLNAISFGSLCRGAAAPELWLLLLAALLWR